MRGISFEYDFPLFIYDNIFAYVEYWERSVMSLMTQDIFNSMLLVKILSISVADEELTRVGLVISGQRL